MPSDSSYIGNYFELLMYMLAKFNVNLRGITRRVIQGLEQQTGYKVTECTALASINQMLLDTYGANVGLNLCGTQKEVEDSFHSQIIQSRLEYKNQHKNIA